LRLALGLLTALVVAGLAAWLLVAGDDPGDSRSSEAERSAPAGEGAAGEEEEEEVSNVFVADLGSGRVARLTANEGEEQFASDPDWAANGQSLIYTQVPCDDCEPFIELVPTTGTKTAPRRVGKGSQPSFLPDGRRFAFVGRAGGLYVGSVDSPAVRELAAPRRSWTEPAASPAGRRIAAVVHDPGGRSQLAVISLASGRARLLRLRVRSVANPAWSPDGRRLTFAALDADGIWRLYSTDPRGGGRRTVTTAGSDTQPAWSPDGSGLAFVRTTGDSSALFVAEADGTGARPVLARGLAGGQPVWSADGRRIAFVAKGDEIPVAERG
jgi:TolB protein